MATPTVIAHRGYAKLAPENTRRAVQQAVEHDATDMIEVDVHPAACGTPVVIHDHRFEARRNGTTLTDREGIVWETPLEEVTAAEVLESGETVPTLEDVLDLVPSRIGVNVELKSPGTLDIEYTKPISRDDLESRRERWIPFVERVVAVCDRADADVLLSSFAEPALAAATEVASDYDTAPISWGDADGGLAVARRHDSTAIHPRYADVTDDLLTAASDAGVDVNVWTLTSAREADRLSSRVDGLIADVPLEV